MIDHFKGVNWYLHRAIKAERGFHVGYNIYYDREVKNELNFVTVTVGPDANTHLL